MTVEVEAGIERRRACAWYEGIVKRIGPEQYGMKGHLNVMYQTAAANGHFPHGRIIETLPLHSSIIKKRAYETVYDLFKLENDSNPDALYFIPGSGIGTGWRHKRFFQHNHYGKIEFEICGH
jgi:hypothetical protein